MELLDPTYIRDICDYSFGDQSGLGCPGGYMKNSDINNIEFINKYRSLVGVKSYMTLFIDNIRLYKRDGIKYTAIEKVDTRARLYKDAVVSEFMKNNDLLYLCSQLTDMNFIIFTAFEDTPIDEFIFDKIPDNVISIYASNCISFGGKVKPIPYGIQRKISSGDNRHEILSSMIYNNDVPTKLLYINHSLGTNPERIKINDILSNKPWVTIAKNVDYFNYLIDIKSHKFMICPDGNAIGCECHRDWEVLYMRRVPIVVRSEYLERIFDGFPVLFVDSFLDITEELLINNDHLYQSALSMNMDKLDISILYNNYINESLKINN